MEPSPFLFDALLSPQAVFFRPICLNDVEQREKNTSSTSSIEAPQFESRVVKWHCDGSDVDGTRFFALPCFAVGQPPLRIDVYLPDPWDRMIENKERTSGGRRWTAERVLAVLEQWSTQTEDFEHSYTSVPFGSRIMIEDPTKLDVYIQPAYDIELQSLSLEKLCSIWDLAAKDLPPRLDLAELHLLRQPHEAISIVTIPKRYGNSEFVFKSSTTGWPYLYHEIKALLIIPQSAVTPKKPLFLVTKQNKFGGKSGLYGFVQRLETMGSLFHVLQRNIHRETQISVRTQYRWAIQVTSAMIHVQNSPAQYYPDLKTENVLITNEDEGFDAYVIDFEQRGGWTARSPPEIYYIDYLEEIALSTRLSSEIKARYTTMLATCFPNNAPRSRSVRYDGTAKGWSLSWLVLNAEEREAAMVYTLGKLLWCIFELQASINCGLGIDLLSEVNPGFRFPEFQRTPMAIRDCVKRSTAGAPEWRGRTSCFRRHGTTLYPSGDEHSHGSWSLMTMQKMAKEWWQRELDESIAYVQAKIDGRDVQHHIHSAKRPTLRELLELLQREASVVQEH